VLRVSQESRNRGSSLWLLEVGATAEYTRTCRVSVRQVKVRHLA